MAAPWAALLVVACSSPAVQTDTETDGFAASTSESTTESSTSSTAATTSVDTGIGTTDSPPATVDEVFEEAVADGFSGVALVRHEGQIVLHAAAGLASRADGVPNALDTPIGIGSMWPVRRPKTRAHDLRAP